MLVRIIPVPDFVQKFGRNFHMILLIESDVLTANGSSPIKVTCTDDNLKEFLRLRAESLRLTASISLINHFASLYCCVADRKRMGFKGTPFL